MWEEILKAVTGVYLPSMLKFIFGPLAGYGLGLNLITTIVATTAGMMTVVIVIIYSGQIFRERLERFMERNKWLSGNGKIAKFLEKYGLAGIACFTPILLTPIGGSFLALALMAKEEQITKEKVLLYMLIAGSVWATVFSSAIYYFGHSVLPEFFK